MKVILTLSLLLSLNAFSKMTHIFYCIGANNNNSSESIFLELQFQMKYSGEIALSKIILKDLPKDIKSSQLEYAYSQQAQFQTIAKQDYCPRQESFPSMCKTTSDYDSEKYFYTRVDTGLNPGSFSDYSLKLIKQAANNPNINSPYSYGRFNREFTGQLKNCNFKWDEQR